MNECISPQMKQQITDMLNQHMLSLAQDLSNRGNVGIAETNTIHKVIGMINSVPSCTPPEPPKQMVPWIQSMQQFVQDPVRFDRAVGKYAISAHKQFPPDVAERAVTHYQEGMRRIGHRPGRPPYGIY